MKKSPQLHQIYKILLKKRQAPKGTGRGQDAIRAARDILEFWKEKKPRSVFVRACYSLAEGRRRI